MEPIDQNAVVGHGVSIACQAEGFPVPTVTWKQSIGESQALFLKRRSEIPDARNDLLSLAVTRDVLRSRCGSARKRKDVFSGAPVDLALDKFTIS